MEQPDFESFHQDSTETVGMKAQLGEKTLSQPI